MGDYTFVTGAYLGGFRVQPPPMNPLWKPKNVSNKHKINGSSPRSQTLLHFVWLRLCLDKLDSFLHRGNFMRHDFHLFVSFCHCSWGAHSQWQSSLLLSRNSNTTCNLFKRAIRKTIACVWGMAVRMMEDAWRDRVRWTWAFKDDYSKT